MSWTPRRIELTCAFMPCLLVSLGLGSDTHDRHATGGPVTHSSRFLTGWMTHVATHDGIPAGRSINTQRQTTASKQAGRSRAGGVRIEEGCRRHQPAGTPGLSPADADTGRPA